MCLVRCINTKINRKVLKVLKDENRRDKERKRKGLEVELRGGGIEMKRQNPVGYLMLILQ